MSAGVMFQSLNPDFCAVSQIRFRRQFDDAVFDGSRVTHGWKLSLPLSECKFFLAGRVGRAVLCTPNARRQKTARTE